MVFAGDFAALGLFAGGFRRLSLLSLPLGGKVAPKGPDEGAGFEFGSLYPVGISPPRRRVTFWTARKSPMAQATLSCPFGAIHLENR